VHLTSEDGRTHFASEVKNGAFQIESVKAGEYAVTVSSSGAGQAKIPTRYGDPGTSGLKVAVAPGENRFEFNLAAK
jgi:hypothetical protein